MSKIAAIILAAGMSKRMGKPKMLLPWGQTTILGQVIDTIAQAGVDEIVIVSGGAREGVEAEAARLAGKIPLRCIHNPAYAASEMLASLQCGLAGLGPQVDFALIALGDQPQLSLEAARKVFSASGTPGAQLVVPSHKMRRGHPWLVQRALWEQIQAMQPAQTLRDFLNSHAREILYIETDESILKDIDTPEEYSRAKP